MLVRSLLLLRAATHAARPSLLRQCMPASRNARPRPLDSLSSTFLSPPTQHNRTLATSAALEMNSTGSLGQFRRRGGGGAVGRKRGGAGGGAGPSRSAKVPLPTAPGPLHDKTYVESVYGAMGGRGKPPPKLIENAKGVISNYVKALGGDPKYEAKKVNVLGEEVTRVTIVADPDPPANQQSWSYNSASGPSLPPMIQPIVGTGDAKTAKEAEKLAALHACMQLSAKGLFTSSNLPLRAKGGFPPAAAKPAAQPPTSYAPSSFFDGPANSTTYNSTGPAPMAVDAAAPPPPTNNGSSVTLSNGDRVSLEEARAFMDFYCQRFNFDKPSLEARAVKIDQPAPFTRGRRRVKGNQKGQWRATLRVAGAQIGVGEAASKKDAERRAYLDTALYLESCDPGLWDAWKQRKLDKLVSKGELPPHVSFDVGSAEVEEELNQAVWEGQESELYQRAKEMVEREHKKAQEQWERAKRGGGADAAAAASTNAPTVDPAAQAAQAELRRKRLEAKSQMLFTRLQNYQASTEPAIEKMRKQRASLPVTSHADSVIAKINTSPVVVCLAATGSGKTTQLPQLILDDAIMAKEGAKCNIVCTQPRRIAAISVAERVAKERGESIGDSVGYQVRFESKPPRKDGSILFCTTGLFLRRMQADLDRGPSANQESFLDGVTHICVDEVHERDVDTDLLLFVLRRLLHERRKQGKAEVKVILMSATIDPRLFTNYFADPDTRLPAPVIEVPGRSFPVEKHWLDETMQELRAMRIPRNEGGWVFEDESVQKYLARELVSRLPIDERTGKVVGEIDDLDMPYPLLALLVAHVLRKSDDGHVLVFLPGWEEIQAVVKILQAPRQFPLFGIDFMSKDYEIHILHSTVPLADQQAVFEPPPKGIRRIVLSTNIAETSVTIPDVVYVVDAAKCKEKRYDPQRRLSQLVSAWTGTSNVLQRAGRAGRHRPGEYYGIVSRARFEAMDIHQTVEMLRTDLASTAMHVTGLQLPGLTVADVLGSTIQPPEPQRVVAALQTLLHVGAIDRDEKLTSLGRVLLQLPVEAAIGKLCLLGSFFRCLEPAVTLAAILTNRDPFMSPPAAKEEADRVKNSWAPPEFRSDPLTILRAYTTWEEMQKSNQYQRANSFAYNNFLSKPSLLNILKIKEHLISSLDRAGVLQISAGGAAAPAQPAFGRGRFARGPVQIPPELNENGHLLPLLSALIATAVAPNFAIRTGSSTLRTSQDKSCMIHPSSVNSKRNEKSAASRQIYAFGEKSRTGPVGSKSGGQTFLRSTTRIDPLGYMLFGAYDLRVTQEGLDCDGWLPIVASNKTSAVILDDVERLKNILDLSLLRVFEGLNASLSRGRGRGPQQQQRGPRGRQFEKDDEDEDEADEEMVDRNDPTLSSVEVQDLDNLTRNVVDLIQDYHNSMGPASGVGSSRVSTRPSSPSGLRPLQQARMYTSGAATPATSASHAGTPYSSRPPSAGGNNVYRPPGAGAGPMQIDSRGGGGGFGAGNAPSGGNWRRG
ncbi:hypothetical protein AAT19DRAFT_10468 [Rhodotorula toruloides]|uniref:P-loop containing nucleoside triphosphate hydrolase protein n=1 Tax=Rhodotorula toruloides TaxID=5286 RepID=A0A2S9ZYU4_RHOTO|nr:hypothetical protein AAT19DRAFT_10468 [Rhodotorula toruloides]